MTVPRQLRVDPAGGRPLTGRLRAPGDKSISHRALLIGARAEGRSRVRGLSNGDDVRHTLEAVQALGAEVDNSAPGELYIRGGQARLREPEAVIDVGNSGTGIRLLAGFVATIDGVTVLQGDSSIARRPMDRVAVPLRLMGAHVDGRHQGSLPPLVVRGGGLHGTEYRLPVPSAQVKSAVLLAGLGADGPTTVHESVPTRAHTEEMLAAAGAAIEVRTTGQGASVVLSPGPLQGGRHRRPRRPVPGRLLGRRRLHRPGQRPGARRRLCGPGKGRLPGRPGAYGARVELVNEDPVRHTADIHVQAGPLVATHVGGTEVPSLIDEIPVLCVAAALAEGTTTFADAAELRVKETDRVATTVALLRALGAGAEPRADGIAVTGRAGPPFRVVRSTRTATTGSQWLPPLRPSALAGR